MELDWVLLLNEWWKEVKNINNLMVGADLRKKLSSTSKKSMSMLSKRYKLSTISYNGESDLEAIFRENDYNRLLEYGKKLKEKIKNKVWKTNYDIISLGIPNVYEAYKLAKKKANDQGLVDIFSSFKCVNNDYEWIDNTASLIKNTKENSEFNQNQKIKKNSSPTSAISLHTVQKTNRGYLARPLLSVNQFESAIPNYSDHITNLHERVNEIYDKLKSDDILWSIKLKSASVDVQCEFLNRLDYKKLDLRKRNMIAQLLENSIKPPIELSLQGWGDGSGKSITKLLSRTDELNTLILRQCELTKNLIEAIATRETLYELSLEDTYISADNCFEVSIEAKMPEFYIHRIECFKYLRTLVISNSHYSKIIIPAKQLFSLSLASLDKLRYINFHKDNRPENLKSITIKKCTAITQINTLPGKYLEEIHLEDLSDLQQVNFVDCDNVENLRYLTIIKCPKLTLIKPISNAMLPKIHIKTDDPLMIYHAIFSDWSVSTKENEFLNKVDKLIYFSLDGYVAMINNNNQNSKDLLNVLKTTIKNLPPDKKAILIEFLTIISSEEITKKNKEIAQLKKDMIIILSKVERLESEKKLKVRYLKYIDQVLTAPSYTDENINDQLNDEKRKVLYERRAGIPYRSPSFKSQHGQSALQIDRENILQDIYSLDLELQNKPVLDHKICEIKSQIICETNKIKCPFNDFVSKFFSSLALPPQDKLIELLFNSYQDSKLNNFIMESKTAMNSCDLNQENIHDDHLRDDSRNKSEFFKENNLSVPQHAINTFDMDCDPDEQLAENEPNLRI